MIGEVPPAPALARFHPAVSAWFRGAFADPTEIQERAWAEFVHRRHTLIAAPTGSGKTLAAFLAAINNLVERAVAGTLAQQTQILYVSPLKALSNDIERNLREPLRGIREQQGKGPAATEAAGQEPGQLIDVMVRTGDTSPSERARMVKSPPHILVTTPESLYLLLTSEGGRNMLAAVGTVIVDEIHALVGNKRGAHLALSLERLEQLTTGELIRVGLSATQRPIERVADFLVGGPAGEGPDCTIVDVGHWRHMELALEMPGSPLTAVMPHEVWDEIYDRIEQLIHEHQTTLIFVNTRRLAERLAHHLTQRLGPEMVTAHHGSMSKEHRLAAEQRLKSGSLRALVATAALELGIDIGSIDLVCQIGSPRSIAGLLQRVGRSGHTVTGTPKGRVFPLGRDDLVECTALLQAVERGALDQIALPEKPSDVLAQQIVAEVACRDYGEAELFDLVRRAGPYRDLNRAEFDQVLTMLAEGYSTRNGRRSAYIHRDLINEKVRGRKNARITALVAGGVIPDTFDCDVILEPSNTFIGTLNEDFAIESMAGDIFQLGNNSWRILRTQTGKVFVEDARGLSPNIPFWLGEAPGRTNELSQAVSELIETVEADLDRAETTATFPDLDTRPEDGITRLAAVPGVGEIAATQIASFLAAGRAALGRLPSQKRIVMERFFDEAGDMHLVIHSVFGSRLNRAWGLALRKRFCRKFNFELQAAATEEGIILSLGSTHSFPLEEVYDYLSPTTVRDVLIQAMLDAPMFQIRWRWNASTALAVPRRRNGQRIPPILQRMQAEDLVAVVFPDQLACLENISGGRDVPDHPLVNQTVHDCLYEAMDIEGLEQLLTDIKSGAIELVTRDLREPSPLAESLLTARPYAFLDDAPLEERRTHAIRNRRWSDPQEAAEFGRLDAAAIAAVRAEAWPEPRDADELHDALVLCGFITSAEGNRGHGEGGWDGLFAELVAEGRATTLELSDGKFWVAAERSRQLSRVYPEHRYAPALDLPERLRAMPEPEGEPLVELVRARLEALGPVRAAELAATMELYESRIEAALLVLESEGIVFRGHFTGGAGLEWCDRRLLARIHRYTLNRLRREIQPVSAADYMRFLFRWHRLEGESLEGPEAVRAILDQLEGFEAPAAAWEGDLFPSRVDDYDYQWLDALCTSGQLAWGRFRPPHNGRVPAGPIKTTPLAFVPRPNLQDWLPAEAPDEEELSHQAAAVLRVLREHGALFFAEIAQRTRLLPDQVEQGIGELVGRGRVTSDSFIGLRAFLVDAKYRTRAAARSRSRQPLFSMSMAGRWSLFPMPSGEASSAADIPPGAMSEGHVTYARALLRRYGVGFRKLAAHEGVVPWRDLVRIYRRMEARGEIRGGRFVGGVWGEQFALSEAIPELRKTARERPDEEQGGLVSISAADPLNLTGIITPGKRVPGIYSNRILYRDGVPIATKEGKTIQFLTQVDQAQQWELQSRLVHREVSLKMRPHLGKGVGWQ